MTDPVLARRRQYARLATLGKRLGYLAILAACVFFAIGVAAGFEGWTTVAVVTSLAIGSALLLPSIVIGYAVRAAERADRQGDW